MSTVFAQDSFDEVFGQMIAGALPLAGVNAEAAVALVARDILGTEDVHTVSVREPVMRRILYFAAPSKILASVLDPRLPLTAALPGHPAHRGPGAYVLSHEGRSVAALFTGTQLRLLYNDRDIIAETIAEQGLPEYDVSSVIDGYPLTSAYAALQQRVDTTSERVTRVAGGVTALMGLVYLGSVAATGYFDGKAQSVSSQKELAMRQFTADLNLASPLSQQVTGLQRVAANTVKVGGWIERYRMNDGKEAFEVLVPEWVTRDIVANYGREARAELAADGMVRIRRGKIEGEGPQAKVAAAAPVPEQAGPDQAGPDQGEPR
jgi:hypothetical protein